MNWLQRFMYGRHGVDSLSLALFVVYFVLYVPMSFARRLAPPWLVTLVWFISMAILAWAVFRILSRNHTRRFAENQRFLQLTAGLRPWFSRVFRRLRTWWGDAAEWYRGREQRARDKAIYRYFDCPNCKKTLRLPRGKGKIVITCPICKTEFTRKT